MQTADVDLSECIAIIVINWNGWQHTLNCLASLETIQAPRWHLYLVDNASTDESCEKLANLGEHVTLIRSPVNGGWTGGNNVGIKRAIADGHHLFFILNNDAMVKSDTLETLLRVSMDRIDELPILGPIHVKPESHEYDFVGASIDKRTGLPLVRSTLGLQSRDLEEVYETAFIRGAGLFVHRRHFEEVGLFDDKFYLNYDETDWSFRARAKGFRSLMVRDALIEHVGSASIGGGTSPLNIYFMIRNGLLFVERHSSLGQRLRAWKFFVWKAREVGNYRGKVAWLPQFLSSKAGKNIAFRRGVLDYLMRRFGDCPSFVRTLGKDR